MEGSASRIESGIAPGKRGYAVNGEAKTTRMSVLPYTVALLRSAVTKGALCISLFPELYFLIVKFLESGICPEAATVSERRYESIFHIRVLAL